MPFLRFFFIIADIQMYGHIQFATSPFSPDQYYVYWFGGLMSLLILDLHAMARYNCSQSKVKYGKAPGIPMTIGIK